MNPDSFLARLRDANVTRQLEWDPNNTVSGDLSYRGNELAGEVGEACNVLKKLDRQARGIVGSRATVQDLANELADVLICVDLIAMERDIDLEKAVREKYNATSVKYGLKSRL